MKPADHCGVGGKSGRFAMEEDKNRLRDIFGPMGIAQTAVGDAVDPTEMPLHDIGERLIRSVAVVLQQLDVGHALNSPRAWKADKNTSKNLIRD
jgi:hypothetical protein